ncbi:MAG: RNA polymerase sigma-70 factor [Bacteroidales bacterium]
MWRKSDKAFHQLFEKNYNSLEWYAFSYVREREAARDLVSEAFLQLWQRRSNFEDSRDPIPWLKTTIHNRALNHLRDHRKFHPDLEAILHDYDSSQQPFDSVDFKQLQRTLNKTLEKMPERVREVFLLSRDENLKYQQIAERLGISVKTVEVQMGKALRILRENLGEFLPLVILLFNYLRI